MQFNKILFIGLGGAGQRHLRIFKDLLPSSTEFFCYRQIEKTPLLNQDFTVDTSSSIIKKYGLHQFESIEKAFLSAPDLAIISTPSSHHLSSMLMAAESGCGVFVEKPWSDSLKGFGKFKLEIERHNSPFFISFQRRYNPHFQRIHQLISSGSLGNIINAVFNVASYVPDWHSYENFKELYAVRSDLGGGVLLTEIHEIDLVNWWFGEAREVFCAGGTFGKGGIDVEDTAHLTIRYSGFDVQVNLCFMQRRNHRNIFVAGDLGCVEWNQLENRLVHEDYKTGEIKDVKLPDFKMDDMFVNQARDFISNHGAFSTKNQMYAAYWSQLIVEAAKESMTEGCFIQVTDTD